MTDNRLSAARQAACHVGCLQVTGSVTYGGRESSTMVQMLTTQTNKETRCKCSQHNQIHFICSVFLFLVVLWAFAACVLSNWGKCFLNLKVFSEVAARWALSATIVKSFQQLTAGGWNGWNWWLKVETSFIVNLLLRVKKEVQAVGKSPFCNFNTAVHPVCHSN